ncbi:MAG: nicotinamide-nucleotide amidohydrolase family protein [Xanthomonadales bacterium]|nr:nicotinamide-nucleotide amidohydrolase family protein [Xanthomonadales bacterium]
MSPPTNTGASPSPTDAELSQAATRVAEAVQSRGWMLATAESCTGGWIAKCCTDLVGSSAWFERGFVAYSNAAKQQLLGVPEGTMSRHGAVSEGVAAAMAAGAAERAGVQVALSVTGIAGPGGGSADKPVGTVHFGWSLDGEVRTGVQCFEGDRETVRRQTVLHAFNGLLDALGG